MQATTSPATSTPWPDGLIDYDDLIGLGEAANLIRRWTGERTNPSTLWGRARSGRSGVLLPHARFGRHVRTSEQALRWFIEQTTAAKVANAGDTGPSTKHHRVPDDLHAQLAAEGL